jgi:hypothetical protein
VSNAVYANKMEISCKAGSGKTICAMPDVCFTPPQTPATPPGVPIPYPNTGMSSDCSSGSSTVKISDQEVMLKDSSYFKTSTGDEAGAAPKKGIITSSNTGKVYFIAWSMSVLVEGENVVRHLDMTTGNHACETTNVPAPMAHIDDMSDAVKTACSEEITKGKAACKDQSVKKCSAACKAAQKCLLVPKGKDKKVCCKPHTTGHHMIEDHWVKKKKSTFPTAYGSKGYKAAPCVCANRYRSQGTVHRQLHDIQGTFEESFKKGGSRFKAGEPNGGWNYGAGKDAALTAHQDTFKESGCRRPCLEAQLDAFYGPDPNRPLNKPETQALGDSRAKYKGKYGGVAGGGFGGA